MKESPKSISFTESPERPKEHWKNYTVGVMSASSDTNKPAVENTREIGVLLAENGYDARNGGYSSGAMRTFAEGFRDACRKRGIDEAEIPEHLSGVIFSNKAVGTWRSAHGVNEGSKIEETETLGVRASGIIDKSDAIVVVEGGLGTLIEALLSAQGEWILSRDKDKKRPSKPVIVIDSKVMFSDVVELAESRSPGTINTIPEDIYVLSGHSSPSKERTSLAFATLKNDNLMREQLKMILDLYYLRSSEKVVIPAREAQIVELEKKLFDPQSPTRVLTLKERLASKQVFENGGGI